MPETEISLHRDMGKLEGRISSLEAQLAEHRTGMTMALTDIRTDMRSAMAELKKSIDEIGAHIQRDDLTDAQRAGAVKGAWWVLGLIAAALTTLGGFVGVILRSGFK